MELNLPSLVSRFLTPELIARFAAALGLDQGVVGKLVAGALPTMLAGLGNVAATPGGAQRIADAVAAQPPGMLERLSGAIGGGGQAAMLADGSKLLGSLLGGDSLSAIAGALGSHAGADSRAASSVMGLLGPAVMGVIGQQGPKFAADPGAIAGLFASQKDAIAAAMPAGLAGALGAAGLGSVLGQGMAGSLREAAAGVAGAARGAAGDLAQGVAQAAGAAAASSREAAARAEAMARRGASQAAGTVSSAADQAAAQARAATGGIPSWVWIGGAIVAAVVAWWAVAGRDVEPAATTAKQAAQSAGQAVSGAAGQAAKTAQNAAVTVTSAAQNAAAQATQGLAGRVADAGKLATGAMTSLTASLGGVGDAASAAATLPKLRAAAADVDRLGEMVKDMPADAKKTALGSIGAALPALRQAIDKALALPGVGDVLRPVVAPMLDKLDALAKA